MSTEILGLKTYDTQESEMRGEFFGQDNIIIDGAIKALREENTIISETVDANYSTFIAELQTLSNTMMEQITELQNQVTLLTQNPVATTKYDLLWTGGTSAIAAFNTALPTLVKANYDYAGIVACNVGGSYLYPIIIAPLGGTTGGCLLGIQNEITWSRYFTINAAGTISYQTSYKSSWYNNQISIANDGCIPRYVYGIKYK